jgi:hypothetical protein
METGRENKRFQRHKRINEKKVLRRSKKKVPYNLFGSCWGKNKIKEEMKEHNLVLPDECYPVYGLCIG